MDSQRLTFIAYVDGDVYQEYIPIMLWSLKKNYPLENVRIFSSSEPREQVQRLIEEVNHPHYVFQKIDLQSLNRNRLKYKKCLRWILPYEKYDIGNTAYLYFADIDMYYLTFPGTQLLSDHIAHSEYIKQPFSNTVRSRVIKRSYLFNGGLLHFLWLLKNARKKDLIKLLLNGRLTYHRLTGLHFTHKQRFLKSTANIRAKYFKAFETGNESAFPLGNDDEVLLFEIYQKTMHQLVDLVSKTNDSFEMLNPQQPNRWNYRPHHGIHLGDFRNGILEATKILSEVIDETYFKHYIQTYSNQIEEFESFQYFNVLSDTIQNELKLIHNLSIT